MAADGAQMSPVSPNDEEPIGGVIDVWGVTAINEALKIQVMDQMEEYAKEAPTILKDSSIKGMFAPPDYNKLSKFFSGLQLRDFDKFRNQIKTFVAVSFITDVLEEQAV